ncbi:MAG: diacylglycerol kinase [Thermodesulfovibrionales bacterium]|nr:diacylglycerol kinase [Thermodesulfovibrionales bacterium]
MPLRNWIKSANNAIEGILHAAKTQRHVRYHFLAAAVVLLLSFSLGVTKIEFIILSLCAMLVILAEMLNTVIENIVDRLSPEKSDFARTVKDMAAGAVLISASGAVLVGYVILFPYLKSLFFRSSIPESHSKDEIAILSVVIVLILVIILKAYTGKGTPLRGGFPSGHAAVSFSIWLSITLIAGNLLVSLLTLGLAVAISQSRVAVHVHTPKEVIAGALIGLAVTGLLFLIFS